MLPSVQKKIALFGGSFDPPHKGHLAIAHAAVKENLAGRVFFLPCRQSPHKDRAPGATGEQRCDMLRLMTSPFPWAEVHDWELRQQSPSYSWQTAQFFTAAYPDAALSWIMGTDQWEQLALWARPDYLAELLTFIVFPRDGLRPIPQAGFKAEFLQQEFSGSSTEVRNAIAAGLTTDMVTDDIHDYIHKNGLYRPEK